MSPDAPSPAAASATAGEPWREPWLRALLRCPVERAELLDVRLPDGRDGLACTDPGHRAAYPVSGGVPVLLADEALPFEAS